MNRRRQTSVTCVLACIAISALGGCGSHDETSVGPPAVDPEDAAAFALAHYDGNKDGALEAAELNDCPPLALAMPAYDANGDGRLSAAEIADRLTRLYAGRSGLSEIKCEVRLDGRPLPAATVRFRPVDMLGEAVADAQGVTDEQGMTRPTISAELLPDELKEISLLYAGLYHVEVTHAQKTLPSRYNTATELGFEVDPKSRQGSSANFDLKTK